MHADRKYVSEGDVWSVDGVDFIGRLKNAAIDEEVELKDNKAIVDKGQYPVAGSMKASISWEEAVEGASNLHPGDVVAFTGTTVGGDAYSGTFIVGKRTNNYGDDGINRPFNGEFRTITCNGRLLY